MTWRLALDMGTNSLGWAAFELDGDGKPSNLMDCGVRIFPDGREPGKGGRVGDSLAVARRLARGMRRNRDRRIERKKKLMAALVELGLMPADKAERKELEKLDPYELRARAVRDPLAAHDLGRALFQLAQRRGFKSNRKTDSEDEKGKIKPKMSALRAELHENKMTLGQWLHERKENGDSLRFRADEGDYYPDRAMYRAEFDRIKEVQAPHHKLSSEDWDRLRDYHIFFQRPLKPVERGRCEFFIEEYRAHKDLPIAHEFRIYQELNNLMWQEADRTKHELTKEQRDTLAHILNHKNKTLSFGGIRKLKNEKGEPLFPRDCSFNLETGPRDKLNGNVTAIEMRKDEYLGEKWDIMPPAAQNDIIEALHEALDNDALVEDLTAQHGLSEDEAARLEKFPLSSGTTNLSRKFMERCLPFLRDDFMRYNEAVGEVPDDDGVLLDFSRQKVDQLLTALPYYGEILKGSVIGGKPADFDAGKEPEKYYGKINNPTVHVALNQLRKLTNRLAARFGMPDELHVELTRDLKKSTRARDEIAKTNAKNARENERRKKEITEITGEEHPSGLGIKKMKLWEELGGDQLARPCVFCGRPISAGMLFNGEAEIEHILPFSRTLDGGFSNLTISHRHCNRLKGNRTPFEAFASGLYEDQGYVWEEICKKAKSLPKNKQWRFDEDAMERFEKDSGFLARQLNDNAYISRITKRYLAHVCPDNKIVAIPGRLTAMMRGLWGLNGLIGNYDHKERTDHRHHVIDAFVAGLTDRGLLQQVSTDTARGVDARERIKLPEIINLKSQLNDLLKSLIVSFKPDHGERGKMFKDTAYGLVPEDRQDKGLPGYGLVTRKPLVSLKENELSAIRCPDLRDRVMMHVSEARAMGLKLDKALAEFSKDHGVKRVRLLVANQSATPVSSAPYKAYAPDSFVCVDIWAVPRGKSGNWKKGEYNWVGDFWSYGDFANPPGDSNSRKPHPAGRKIMRLFKHDMVSLRRNGELKTMRIAGFSTTNNRLDLRPHTETEGKQNYVSINVLKGMKLEKLAVSEDGRMRGPG